MDLHSYALLKRHLNRISFEGEYEEGKKYYKFDIVTKGLGIYISERDSIVNEVPGEGDTWTPLFDFTSILDNYDELLSKFNEVVDEVDEAINEGKEVNKESIKLIEDMSEGLSKLDRELQTAQTVMEEIKESLSSVEGNVEEVAKLLEASKESLEEVNELNKDAKETAGKLLEQLENANELADKLEEQFVHKGEWKSGTSYSKGNEVLYNGSTYRALDNVSGDNPASSSKWQLIAQRGVDGEGSVQSVNNINPDSEGNIDLEDNIVNIIEKNVQVPEDMVRSVDGVSPDSSGNVPLKAIREKDVNNDYKTSTGKVKSSSAIKGLYDELTGKVKDLDGKLGTMGDRLDEISKELEGDFVPVKDFDTHKKLEGGEDVKGHVGLSDDVGSYSSRQYGIAATPFAVTKVKAEIDKHEDKEGSRFEVGHVNLSDSTSDVANANMGTAATPLAVKIAYDKAEQALQSGNKQKQRMVDSLLSADDSLPVGPLSSWEALFLTLDKVLSQGGTKDVKLLMGHLMLTFSGRPTSGTIYEDVVIPTNLSKVLDVAMKTFSKEEFLTTYSKLLGTGLVVIMPTTEKELDDVEAEDMVSTLVAVLSEIPSRAKRTVSEVHAELAEAFPAYFDAYFGLTAVGRLKELNKPDGRLSESITDLGELVAASLRGSGADTEKVIQEHSSGGFQRMNGNGVSRSYIEVRNLYNYDIVLALQDSSSGDTYSTFTLFLNSSVSPFGVRIVSGRFMGNGDRHTIDGFKESYRVEEGKLPLNTNYREADGSSTFNVYKFKL